MEAKENIELRLKMANMHTDVLKRINNAYEQGNNIEVCWLCYACFESRVNRILYKICSGCAKSSRKDGRKIGISTKLECLSRLIKYGYEPLQKENIDHINAIKGWCKERNLLIHGLVSLDCYNDADKKFANLAKRGKKLVEIMYSIGKDVREYYYKCEAIPCFPEETILKCRLKSKCLKDYITVD